MAPHTVPAVRARCVSPSRAAGHTDSWPRTTARRARGAVTVPAVNISELRHELTTALLGDVRFDAVSRALYSTDASVYQIEPVGVALPRSRDDLRIVRICVRHSCPITMRGGGTSQAGQAIGAGLIVDTSSLPQRDPRVECRRAMGSCRTRRRARRAERPAPSARLALCARRLDREPRHRRRNDGEQLERRAVGDLRQDDRSRHRTGGRAVRWLGRHIWAAQRRRTSEEVPATPWRRGVIGPWPRSRPLTRRKSSAVPKVLRV